MSDKSKRGGYSPAPPVGLPTCPPPPPVGIADRSRFGAPPIRADDPDMVDMIRLASYLAQDAAEARKGKGRRVSMSPAQAERASDILLAYVNRKVEDHAASLGI